MTKALTLITAALLAAATFAVGQVGSEAHNLDNTDTVRAAQLVVDGAPASAAPVAP
jgi:hypothetical protein